MVIPNASEWAAQQWAESKLHDARLTRRAVEMGAKMAAHPEASLPEQMQNPSALDASYRLLNHRHLTMADLTASHCEQTLAAARQHAIVLWVEDTTELDYTAHPSKTGLGPIGDGRGRGLLLHSTLGVLPDTRTVLGLGHAQVVLRAPTPKSQPHWTRSPEGRVWEVSAERIGSPPPDVTWVHVSDRASDIYEYMAACVSRDKHFVLRVYHNRVLTWDQAAPQATEDEAHQLMDYARRLVPQPDSGYTVEVAATKKHPARTAHVVLAWAPITVSPPTQAPPEVRQLPTLSLWVVRVWEPNPPEGVEPVEWILLTSLPVITLADAYRTVAWYTCRWLCEDYHQCLKTGCRTEASQLDDGADLQRLLGFHAPIAVRLLQLRQAARETPTVPVQTLADPQALPAPTPANPPTDSAPTPGLARTLVDPLMVTVLAHLVHLNAHTMTVAQFWQGVARLGGHQGRRRDGPPGWRTVWRGWRYLSDLTEGARLFAPLDST